MISFIENLELHKIGEHSKEHHLIIAENKALKKELENLRKLLNEKN